MMKVSNFQLYSSVKPNPKKYGKETARRPSLKRKDYIMLYTIAKTNAKTYPS